MSGPGWRHRLTAAAATFLGLWAFLEFVGFDVQPVLLASSVLLVLSVTWALNDVTPSVRVADWVAMGRQLELPRGEDPRFSRLARRLSRGTDREAVASEIHSTLVGLVDDRLRAKYGVDRATDPDTARRILGPEIDGFLSEGGRHHRARYVPYLSDVLTRIESL